MKIFLGKSFLFSQKSVETTSVRKLDSLSFFDLIQLLKKFEKFHYCSDDLKVPETNNSQLKK